jgi:hypothetical protein
VGFVVCGIHRGTQELETSILPVRLGYWNCFSPADHHGIWAMQREGTLSKGIVPDHLVTFLEDLAKRKGLV